MAAPPILLGADIRRRPTRVAHRPSTASSGRSVQAAESTRPHPTCARFGEICRTFRPLFVQGPIRIFGHAVRYLAARQAKKFAEVLLSLTAPSWRLHASCVCLAPFLLLLPLMPTRAARTNPCFDFISAPSWSAADAQGRRNPISRIQPVDGAGAGVEDFGQIGDR